MRLIFIIRAFFSEGNIPPANGDHSYGFTAVAPSASYHPAGPAVVYPSTDPAAIYPPAIATTQYPAEGQAFYPQMQLEASFSNFSGQPGANVDYPPGGPGTLGFSSVMPGPLPPSYEAAKGY